MKNIVLILLTILYVTCIPFPVNGTTRHGRTIVLKKKPRRNHDTGDKFQRAPCITFTCEVEKDSGIQPIDTSEIETFEVWDCTDTAPIAIYDDEKLFVDYILNESAEGSLSCLLPITSILVTSSPNLNCNKSMAVRLSMSL